MNIILLEKIDNLGGIGDQVKVKSGYARNFLIPSGKATPATPENVAKFEEIRAELEKKAAEEVAAAEARAKSLEGKVIRLTAQAGSEGRLFGSIGTIDIAAACAELGAPVERSEIRMPEGPIRVLGEYQIDLHLHTDVNVTLTVIVEPAGGGEAMPPTLEDAEEETDAASLD
jgi:large subunit ribosomal protein L9